MRIKSLKNNRTKGFTIIELLVVIIIIAIVASIGTNTYQSQRSQARYNNSIIKVLGMIKQARNYAVSSRAVYDETKNPGEESYIPPEGYGVYIERSDTPGASRFVLFANTETNDPEEQDQYDEGKDIIEEEYFLSLETNFIGLFTDQDLPTHTAIGGGDDNKAVIIFRPPLADAALAVNDNPVQGSLTTLNDLYLEFKRTEAHVDIPSRYIHVNKVSGLAESVKL